MAKIMTAFALVLACAAGAARASNASSWECPTGYATVEACGESGECDTTDVVLGSGAACSGEGAALHSLDGGAAKVYDGCVGAECCNCWKVSPPTTAQEDAAEATGEGNVEAEAQAIKEGDIEVEALAGVPVRRCFDPCELDCRAKCYAPWAMSCHSYCQQRCLCACPYQCQQSVCRSSPNCRRGAYTNAGIVIP